MRMMKGDEEPEVVIGAIIFVVAIGFVFLILFMNMSDFDAAVVDSQKKINAINEAHLAMACLRGGAAFADETRITNDVIKSCGIGYKVCVKDIENAGRTWLDCTMENPDHTIYLAIKTGDNIHMGELDVKK